MSTDHGFTSVFAPQLEEYLAFKEAMGFYGTSRVWYLRKFDAYCVEHDRAVFDKDTVEGWVTDRLTRSGAYRSWMSYIRDFGRWLQAHAHAEAYVLSERWKAPLVPADPYLLSGAEIEAFFAAAAHLRAASPWAWQAVAFFTLMHCCGIRTGEARALGTQDVDLRRGRIDIVSSKGNRSRRLPVTADVVKVLQACDQVSNASFPTRRSFFVSAAGTQVSPATVGVIFNRIWDQAALARRPGGPTPRPYDLRHHFAYANIERWAAQGKDVAAMLPYLAAYMGHATFESTYYYVHTSPDFMAAYADIASSSTSVLPQVGFA
jgi:integrase